MQRKKVVLPEPEEPIIETTSPFSMVKSIPFRTCKPPKDLFIFLISTPYNKRVSFLICLKAPLKHRRK